MLKLENEIEVIINKNVNSSAMKNLVKPNIPIQIEPFLSLYKSFANTAKMNQYRFQRKIVIFIFEF